MKRRKHTGRNSHSFATNTSYRAHAACRLSAATLTAFLQIPAFLSSCTPPQAPAHTEKQIYIQWGKNPIPRSLDLFFFDSDGAQALDSWQKIDLSGNAPALGLCCSGSKRMVALSRPAGSQESWYSLRSYPDLCKHTFSLQDESPDAPLLAGEMQLQAAVSRSASLTMHPLLTCIRIRSVSCDFGSLPYSGLPFVCNKLFLSYAGSECLPLGTGDRVPVSWINAPDVDSTAVGRLAHPEMLLQPGLGALGPERAYPNRAFYCYPSAQTRLVLEGSVGDDRCYYPIPLPDLQPGGCYELDIRLCRKGSPHPDIPVESETAVVESALLPWEHRESETFVL